MGTESELGPSLNATEQSLQLYSKDSKQSSSASQKGREKKSSGTAPNEDENHTQNAEGKGRKGGRSHHRSHSQRHATRTDTQASTTSTVQSKTPVSEKQKVELDIAPPSHTNSESTPTPSAVSISQLSRDSPPSDMPPVPPNTPQPFLTPAESTWTFNHRPTSLFQTSPDASAHNASRSPASRSPPPMLAQQRQLSPVTTSPVPTTPPPLKHSTSSPPCGLVVGGPPTTPPPLAAVQAAAVHGAPPLTPPQCIGPPSVPPPVRGGPPTTPPPLATIQAAAASVRGGPPPLPPPSTKRPDADWYEMFDSVTGKTYYFDRNNNVAVWERPANFSEWKELVDPGTQKTYYFNQTTKETVWKVPAGYAASKACENTSSPIGGSPSEESPASPPSIAFAQATVRARTKSATKTLRLCAAKRAAAPCPRAAPHDSEGHDVAKAVQDDS